jgi:cytochrome P450
VDQVLDQIPTFLVAGHDTTAVGVTWCLFSLAVDKSIQARLRTELLQVFPDDTKPVTMEALNSIPYLDAVVRETLRYNPPIDHVGRVAMADDIIPLEKPLLQKDGKEVNYIQYDSSIFSVIPV